MKKLLALVLALTMLLACAAMAAPADSSVYGVRLSHPILYINGTPYVDATGLALTAEVYVGAEAGGLKLALDVGDNLDDNALTAAAQVTQEGLVLALQGLAHTYKVGFEDLLALAEANGVDMSEITGMSSTTSAVGDIPTLEELLDGIAASKREENGATIYEIDIDQEQSVEYLDAMLDAMRQANVDDLPASAAELGITFTLSGTAVVTDDTADVNLSGNVYSTEDGSTLPLTITYKKEAAASNLVVRLSDGSDTIELLGNTMTADVGTVTFDYRLCMYGETLASVTGQFDDNVDQLSFMVSAEMQEEGEIQLSLYSDKNAPHFLFNLSAMSSDQESVIANIQLDEEDENGQTVRKLRLNVGANEQLFTLEGYADSWTGEADSDAWMIDASDAVNILTMTDSDSSALATGAIGVLGTLMAKLQENVPGVADLIASLM